jgi:hypothetical protein
MSVRVMPARARCGGTGGFYIVVVARWRPGNLGGSMQVQSRAAVIADALDGFINQWQNQDTVAGYLAEAYDSLATWLAGAGINYQDNEGSKQANPGVNGLQIGEVLDLLHTLYTFSYGGSAGFLPAKFWHKLIIMRDVMREQDLPLSDEESSEHDGGDGDDNNNNGPHAGDYFTGEESGYDADIDEPS